MKNKKNLSSITMQFLWMSVLLVIPFSLNLALVPIENQSEVMPDSNYYRIERNPSQTNRIFESFNFTSKVNFILPPGWDSLGSHYDTSRTIKYQNEIDIAQDKNPPSTTKIITVKFLTIPDTGSIISAPFTDISQYQLTGRTYRFDRKANTIDRIDSLDNSVINEDTEFVRLNCDKLYDVEYRINLLNQITGITKYIFSQSAFNAFIPTYLMPVNVSKMELTFKFQDTCRTRQYEMILSLLDTSKSIDQITKMEGILRATTNGSIQVLLQKQYPINYMLPMDTLKGNAIETVEYVQRIK
jgi:hypothetical protein